MADREKSKHGANTSKLTMKQQRFVDAYLGEAKGNASAAARIAGYASPGQEGHRLLKNAEIAAIVGDVVAASAMDRDEVLERLSAIARGAMPDFLTVVQNGPRSEWIVDLAKAQKAGALWMLRKIKVDPAGMVTVEPYDALKALQLLAQYHNLLKGVDLEGEAEASGAPMRVEVVYVDESPRVNRSGEE